MTIFGDCDLCADRDVYNLPEDGKLWLLLDFENLRGNYNPDDNNLTRDDWETLIEDIKMNLVENYAPNTSWWPYAVEVNSINVNLNAYRDSVLAVTAEFLSCQLNDQHEYVCTTTNINNNPKP